MASFLRKVYTVKECQSRALPVTGGEGEKKEDEADVMRWRDEAGAPDVTKVGEKGSVGSGDQQVSSVTTERTEATAKGTGKASSSQKINTAVAKSRSQSSRKAGKKSSTGVGSGSESAESLSESTDDADDIPLSRSSPPRTRRAARQAKGTPSAPSSPMAPNPYVAARASPNASPAASPVRSPPASPSFAPSPAPSPLVQFSGTSPSSHSYRSPSPDGDRPPSPSPGGNRSSSPLPCSPACASPKQLGVDSDLDIMCDERNRQQAESVSATGMKRKEVEDGEHREKGTARTSKKARVGEKRHDTEQKRKEQGGGEHCDEDTTRSLSSARVGEKRHDAEHLPEIPDGVGNTKEDAYIKQAMTLFGHEDVAKMEGWGVLVRKWLELEAAEGYQGGKLATGGRPAWVTEWIQRGRSATWLSTKHDAFKVLDQWWAWWEELQPDWRGFDNDGRPDLPEAYIQDGSWKSLRICGTNGLTSVLVALAYTAVQLARLPTPKTGRDKKEQSQAFLDWTAAVNDVEYALDGMLTSTV
ncbi:SERTA domain-containing protein 3 [Marasmius crinis-equi]|uniref:SERTA domain-containing protein 3 n=1 Tax=Marasmius crinis-equi TaxID=585013 RepID=A0ABR3F5C7_9AGAR